MVGSESHRSWFESNLPASSSSPARGWPIGKLARIRHPRVVVVVVAVVVDTVVIVDVVGSRATGSDQNPDLILARIDPEQLRLDDGPQTCTDVQTGGGARKGRGREGGRGPQGVTQRRDLRNISPWVTPQVWGVHHGEGARGGPRPTPAGGGQRARRRVSLTGRPGGRRCKR